MPNVLVLMATYNGEPWIEEQISSILNQRDIKVTLQISDDASKDGTVNKIQSAFGSDSRVRVQVNSKPSGTAGANFRGLFRTAEVTGFDFVALADQDDIWHEQKISRAVENLKRTGAVGYSSAVNAFWANGKRSVIKQSPNVKAADFLFEGAGQGCTFVMTAEHFRNVQQYCRSNAVIADSLHYHDWLVYLIARSQGKLWSFDDQPSMEYRQHPSNEIGARGGLSGILKRIELIKNGWYKKQVEAASKIYVSLCPSNDQAIKIINYFNNNKNRIRKAYLIFTQSRRKTSDRLVLTISSAIGWF